MELQCSSSRRRRHFSHYGRKLASQLALIKVQMDIFCWLPLQQQQQRKPPGRCCLLAVKLALKLPIARLLALKLRLAKTKSNRNLCRWMAIEILLNKPKWHSYSCNCSVVALYYTNTHTNTFTHNQLEVANGFFDPIDWPYSSAVIHLNIAETNWHPIVDSRYPLEIWTILTLIVI